MTPPSLASFQRKIAGVPIWLALIAILAAAAAFWALLLFLWVIFWSIAPRSSSAERLHDKIAIEQDDASEIRYGESTLAGHKKVLVKVLHSDNVDSQILGLKDETLTTFVVDALNTFRVDATDKSDAGATLVLHVNVSVLKLGETGLFAFSTSIDARQRCKLSADDRTVMASTWSTGRFGNTAKGDALLREAIEQSLLEFVFALKTANNPPSDPFAKP